MLSRRTRVATNTRLVVEAAWPKPVMFFPARFDHWLVQTGDGYAAHIAGAIGVSTDAQASWWGSRGIGTVPHALIAAFGGDTVAATMAFAEHMPADVKVVSLVDFDNDCVGTSLAVARALGPRLAGVRLDTSGDDGRRSVVPLMGGFDPRGVNPHLVRAVRSGLDAQGFHMSRSPSRAASILTRSAASRRPACRSTGTASDRRSSPAGSISPPTSSWWTAGRPRSAAAASVPTPVWSPSIRPGKADSGGPEFPAHVRMGKRNPSPRR